MACVQDLFLHLILQQCMASYFHFSPAQKFFSIQMSEWSEKQHITLHYITYPFGYTPPPERNVVEIPVSPPRMNIVHLSIKHQWLSEVMLFKFVFSSMSQWMTCTDLNGEDSCISDQERFDLEGLAEGSSLIHGAHGCCLICIDILPQLFSAWKIHNYNCRYFPFNLTKSNSVFSNQDSEKTMWNQSSSSGRMWFLMFLMFLKVKVIQMRATSQWLTLTSPQLWAALPEPWGHGWSHLLKSPAQFHPVGRNVRPQIHSSNTNIHSFIRTPHYSKKKNDLALW